MDEKLKQVTYRIPGGLSDALEQLAKDRQIPVSQLVREALEDAINPKRRIFEYPGFTPQFQAFLEERTPKGYAAKRMLLLVEDLRGRRYLYDGTLQQKGGSLIVIASHRSLVPIPLPYIQTWYPVDDDSQLFTLVQSLLHQGWVNPQGYALPIPA